MHAFCCDVARAFRKLGIAIAAKRPIMATTIMISTSVKPALREVLIFMLLFFLLGGVNAQQAGYYDFGLVHSLPVATALCSKLAASMPMIKTPLWLPGFPSWRGLSQNHLDLAIPA